MAKKRNTIIYKTRRGNSSEPYKAGMWKVAYADFITAMMSFFLLLWLLSVTPENTLQGVAKYFAHNTGTSDKAGLGFEGGADTSIDEGIAAPDSTSSALIYGSPSRGRKIDQARKPGMMTDEEKEHLIAVMSGLQKNVELTEFSDNISIDVTNEGIRIQIMDSDDRPMFKQNTSELEPYMLKILTVVGRLIKNQPNYISITGNTARIKANGKQDNIDYWNLSAVRANEVRKFLTQGLINSQQVERIIGNADRDPFDLEDPFSPKNIRISITLLNNTAIGKSQLSAPVKSFAK